MNRNLPSVALLFVLLVGVPALCLAGIQTQRAQISVNITIDVTPNPLGFLRRDSQPSDTGIVARLTVNRSENARTYRAEQLSFDTSAVAQNQGAIKTEAEISPNPNATLLYSTPIGVTFSQEAGTTVVYTCPYTVTVDSTVMSWSLDHGLFTDFQQSGGSGTFPGKDVANNTYISTPRPTATPFVVYADDGGTWVAAASGQLKQTYCVDLTITIPIATSGGTYSSNAVYTLLY